MKDNDEFFDPDLDQDNNVLTGLTASESESLHEADNISLSEDKIEETKSHETDSSVPLQKKKFEILGYDLKWCLGLSAIAIALVVYAVWPDTPNTDTTSGPLIDQQQTSTSPQNPGAQVTGNTLPAPIQPDDDQLRSNIVKLAKVQQRYSEDNRQAISALASRLSADEQQISTLKTELNAQSTQIGAMEALLSKRPEPQSVPHKALHQVTKRHASASTTGWSVNTIYPGMAWLQHSGSTWAVHVGDDVAGLHINTIDAEHRVVITDRGIIR
ncbi:hypothetical protein KX75_20655 [Salmonella enterica subsp. enterica]|nr:hypothetical protein [Salmonella enterica subsp. enterica serovar Mikawasima]EDN7229278.1 GPO family capsid scaffolding protein [Salmonella enterica subsp. enterica serovar Mikawasima]